MHLVKPEGLWSLSALATEFKIDRRKCGALLEGIPPGGESKGHPVFRIADVALALGTYKASGTSLQSISGNDEFDPDMLPPKERKEQYEGTLKKMDIEVRRGQLVPIDAHREGLSDMAKTVKNAMAGLADTVDAEVGLPPEAVEAIDEIARGVLDSIAEEMISD